MATKTFRAVVEIAVENENAQVPGEMGLEREDLVNYLAEAVVLDLDTEETGDIDHRGNKLGRVSIDWSTLKPTYLE